jgi:hypothetical protein
MMQRDEILEQLQRTRKFALCVNILPPPNKLILLISSTRKRANFCNGAFEDSFRSLNGNYPDVAIYTRVSTQDNSSWPLEWGSVVLLYEDEASSLDIGLVLLPSLALLQTLEVVCRPLVPELLELLLQQLPSGNSLGNWWM